MQADAVFLNGDTGLEDVVDFSLTICRPGTVGDAWMKPDGRRPSKSQQLWPEWVRGARQRPRNRCLW